MRSLPWLKRYLVSHIMSILSAIPLARLRRGGGGAR